MESAINNREHRGLDRVRSKGSEGFARTVALSVVALNVHRLGSLLRQQAWKQHRLAAWGRRKEQPDPTRQLREPTGIPNDDRTMQKSPIEEDRVEKLALIGRE